MEKKDGDPSEPVGRTGLLAILEQHSKESKDGDYIEVG